MVLCVSPVSLGNTGSADKNGLSTVPLSEGRNMVTLNVDDPQFIELDDNQSKKPIELDLKKISNLKQEKAAENQSMPLRSGYNPLGAEQIYLDTDKYGTFTASGQQHIYYLQITSAGKLTEMLEVPPSVNYDIALYRINPPGEGYTPLASSNYGTGYQSWFGREQFSYNVSAGDYYVIVGSVSGYSSTPYRLLVTESTGYGSHEPNDYLNQANSVGVPTVPDVQIDDNIDNENDWDFYRLNFAGAGEYRVDFYRLSGSETYKMELYQSTGGGLSYLGFLNQNSCTFLNMSGTYYIRVAATSYGDDCGQYRINLRKRMNSVQIESIWSPPNFQPLYGPCQKCDSQVFGVSEYVVQDEAEVRGIARDAQGNPVPNAWLDVRFDSVNQDYPHVYSGGYTDSSGHFYIDINLPLAWPWTRDAWYNNYRFEYAPGYFIVWNDYDEPNDTEEVIHLYQVVYGG